MMVPTDPEDIKAAIRKKCGSLLAFEKAHGLGARSATDALIGRRRPATARAIAELLGHDVSLLFPGKYESAIADDSATGAKPQHLNAGTK